MRIKLVARVMALIIVVAFCGWMITMMTIGMPGTRVTELPLYPTHGDGRLDSQMRSTVYQPYLPAIIPMTLVLITGLGFLHDRVTAFAWIGIGLLVVIGFPLIFGLGIVCWGIAALLVVPLSVIQSEISGKRVWLIAGGMGTASLLWGAWAFQGGAFGWMTLAAGGISLLLLAWLAIQSHQQQAMMP